MPEAGHWRCEWCGEMGYRWNPVSTIVIGTRRIRAHQIRCAGEATRYGFEVFRAGRHAAKFGVMTVRARGGGWTGLL